MVNETPYCLWDRDIPKRSRDFLARIDPNYFLHVAELNAPLLEGEQKQFAAMTLQMAYSHSLETLFAFLCTTIQSPFCPAGWMLKYTNSDLREVVRKISNGEPVASFVELDPFSWESLARVIIHPSYYGDDGEERLRVLQKGYGETWQELADEFLRPSNEDQYNSVKHGMRAGMGGFAIKMDFFSEPDMPEPPENTIDFQGSLFGASYLEVKPLSQQKDYRANFQVAQHHVNWNPQKFVDGLHFVTGSIHNILVFLKTVSGEEVSTLTVYPPQVGMEEKAFGLPWQSDPPDMLNFAFEEILNVPDSSLPSKEELTTRIVSLTRQSSNAA